MMIKKQLGVLAGSVMLASGAMAAVEPGSFDASVAGGVDSSLMLALIDNDAASGEVSTFWIEVGVSTVANLVGPAPTGFEFQLSANAVDFLAVADDYALFGNRNQGGTATLTSFGGSSISGDDVGTVYAATAPQGAKGNFSQLDADRLLLQQAIQAVAANVDAGGGEFGVVDGDAGDLSGSLAFTDILNPVGLTSLLFYSNSADNRVGDPSEDQIMGISQVSIGLSTAATDDIVFLTEAAVIPVPAAAWLFGSALLGLGVVRRKN